MPILFIYILQSLGDLIYSQADLIRLVFFVGFFTITAVAYYYHDRIRIRQSWLVFVFTVVIIMNTTGIYMVPFAHLHKFTGAAAQEQTVYEVRVVDEHGETLSYDARAVEPLPGSRLNELGKQMTTEYSNATRHEVSRFLLQNACEYRSSIESGQLIRLDRMEFPEHGLDYRWTDKILSTYGDFAGIHVYKHSITHTDHGTDETVTTELVYRWRPSSSASENGEVITACS